MPLHHHGGMPHTKAQRRKRIDDEILLEQAAGNVRHDVDAEPFNHGRWERAVNTHTAGQRPAATPGGTLTAIEDAATLRSQGNMTFEAAQAAITAVSEGIDTLMQTVAAATGAPNDGVNVAASILGEGHEHLNEIFRAAAAFAEGFDPAKKHLEQMRQDLNDMQAKAAMFSEAFNNAANAIGGGAA